MAPTLEEGDFILFKTASCGQFYGVGKIVVLKRLGEPMMIRRVATHNEDGSYQLAGDNADSMVKTDMLQVQKQQILGKVVLKIGPRGMEILS